MARPTDYKEELLEKARDYRANWNAIYPNDVVPSLEGLALHIGISRETIYAWEGQEGKEEFSDIVDVIRKGQAKELVNKGLKGDFNSSIAKVMLSKHGYSEKTEIDHTTKGEKIDNSDAVKELTQKLNELHRGTSISGDGGTTSPLGTEARD